MASKNVKFWLIWIGRDDKRRAMKVDIAGAGSSKMADQARGAPPGSFPYMVAVCASCLGKLRQSYRWGTDLKSRPSCWSFKTVEVVDHIEPGDMHRTMKECEVGIAK